MSKYIIDINEMEDCNKNLNSAKLIIENVTKDGNTFFQGLAEAWEGAAADAFAARFMSLNSGIASSYSVIDTLIDKNNAVKNDFIQTDKATKHVDLSNNSLSLFNSSVSGSGRGGKL